MDSADQNSTDKFSSYTTRLLEEVIASHNPMTAQSWRIDTIAAIRAEIARRKSVGTAPKRAPTFTLEIRITQASTCNWRWLLVATDANGRRPATWGGTATTAAKAFENAMTMRTDIASSMVS